MYKEISTHLPFSTLNNARDLGGIPASEGKVIKPDRLIRSAHLHELDEKDLLTLKEMGLSDVMDFRTEWEVIAEPDKLPAGTVLHHNPVVHEMDLKHMVGSQIKVVEDLAKHADKLLEGAYAMMITSADAQKAWRSFFDLLLKKPQLVLWHCTQGKDRTGMATILLLHALGVKEEDIRQEYLQTNLYMSEKDTQARVAASLFLEDKRKAADADISAFLMAKPSFYDAAAQAVEDHYGDWGNYLSQALQLSEEDIQILKDEYLE